jgi:hypothetical protein
VLAECTKWYIPHKEKRDEFKDDKGLRLFPSGNINGPICRNYNITTTNGQI